MQMKYEDPNMEAYWNTLSPQVQARIEETGIALCSLGMLRKLGDYYQNSREEQGAGEVTHMRKDKQEISSPKPDQVERPIPAKIYPAIDTDLGRDNLENDLPAAELEDL